MSLVYFEGNLIKETSSKHQFAFFFSFLHSPFSDLPRDVERIEVNRTRFANVVFTTRIDIFPGPCQVRQRRVGVKKIVETYQQSILSYTQYMF